MSYESPITIINNAAKEITRLQEEAVLKAVISTGITIDKEELIKALSYDRQQYEKGFADGAAFRNEATEVVRCKDCARCQQGRAGLYCSLVDFLLGEDDYCSKGVKKDDG